MCGLCGAYRREPHWSDPLDGFDTRRQRYARAALASRVTANAGIKVKDFCGASYIVSNRKGKTQICYTADHLWEAIIQLGECSLDPLGDAFIARAEQNR